MSLWVFFLILTQLILVSWIDIKIKKISNLWLLLNTLLAVSLHFILPESYPWDWASLIFPIGWIVLGFFLYLIKVMGAGDSKYLASLFLIIPLELQGPMFEKIVYSTLVVGMVTLLFKIAKDFQKIRAYAFISNWKGLIENIRSEFSYAPVILIAWILLGAQRWF